MKTVPRILDAFCHAGGAAAGYHLAGFTVVGIDIQPMSRQYPFEFIEGDAIQYIREHGHEYDMIHASPPCQDHIAITAGNRQRPGWTDNHINLVPQTRAALAEAAVKKHLPTVIECGVGKHLRKDISLCGEMFGLGVIRHRWFEIDGINIPQPQHLPHRGRVAGIRHGEWFTGPYLQVYGKGGGKGNVKQWQKAMGIDWISSRRGLQEAIPPAYTQYIGTHALKALTGR